jgi:hypothetical protein
VGPITVVAAAEPSLTTSNSRLRFTSLGRTLPTQNRQHVHVQRGLAEGALSLVHLECEQKCLCLTKVRSCKRSARRRPLPNNNSSSSSSKRRRGHERAACCSLPRQRFLHCRPTQRCTRASERCKLHIPLDLPRHCGEKKTSDGIRKADQFVIGSSVRLFQTFRKG